MATKPTHRNLTEHEQRAFKMLAAWEELVDNMRLYGTIEMSPLAIATLQGRGITKPLSVLPSPSSPSRRLARFDLVEMARYLSFVCKTVGLTVDLYGDVMTQDGIKLSLPVSTKPIPNYYVNTQRK